MPKEKVTLTLDARLQVPELEPSFSRKEPREKAYTEIERWHATYVL